MKSDQFTQLTDCARKSEMKKRYLGKVERITPLQRTWVRCLLNTWGEKYGGSVGPDGGKINVIGRLMIRGEWSEREAERIKEVVNALHEQGYTGTELFLKAKQIISPQNTVSNLLDRANEQEDADLVESVICRIFAANNPIRLVAIKYHCERKCSQDIATDLARLTGIDVQSAWRRVKWCRELLEESVYHALKRELDGIVQQSAA
ncbi:class II holin [Pantoea phage PA-1]